MRQIRCKYIGTQVWRYGSFKLYNLCEQMGEHPVNSTVSENTIHSHDCEPVEAEEEVAV
jgi:hypothetical protein